MVRHLNKTGGAKVLYRGGGSIGIVGLTRAAIYVGPNPENTSEKVMAQIKNNLGPLMSPWGFKIMADVKGLKGIRWTGQVGIPLSRILDAKVEQTPRELAMSWLSELLTRAGEEDVQTIMLAAKSAGIAYGTLMRVKKEMNVTAVRKGSRAFAWTLAPPPAVAGALFDAIKDKA